MQKNQRERLATATASAGASGGRSSECGQAGYDTSSNSPSRLARPLSVLVLVSLLAPSEVSNPCPQLLGRLSRLLSRAESRVHLASFGGRLGPDMWVIALEFRQSSWRIAGRRRWDPRRETRRLRRSRRKGSAAPLRPRPRARCAGTAHRTNNARRCSGPRPRLCWTTRCGRLTRQLKVRAAVRGQRRGSPRRSETMLNTGGCNCAVLQ